MNNISYKEVGKRLSIARKKAGFSLEEVGRVVGVDRTTVSRWEKGQTSKIILPIIEKLASLYKVNPSWLAGINEKQYLIDKEKVKIASYNGIDTTGLDDDDIEEINNYIKNIVLPRKKKK